MNNNGAAKAQEALDMARALIQEAKGAEGDMGYVVSHLDDAENWLDKVEALTLQKAGIMNTTATAFQNRVWEAFWTDGNNEAGIKAVVSVVFAEAARIAKETAEDAPEVADSGGTRDGWEMACKAIAARISEAA